MINDSENAANMQPLFDFYEQFHPLSEGFIDYHLQTCKHITIKKNKFILSPIDNNHSMYFLLEGIVRGFVKVGSKDISTWFGFENELITAIRQPNEYLKPSYEYVQAIEDSQLICIPYNNIELLAKHYPETNIIGRKLFEMQFYTAAERAILGRIPSAIERYLKLHSSKMKTDGIPLRYLASYLGMRLETLSRIRTKLMHTDNLSHQLEQA